MWEIKSFVSTAPNIPPHAINVRTINRAGDRIVDRTNIPGIFHGYPRSIFSVDLQTERFEFGKISTEPFLKMFLVYCREKAKTEEGV